MTGTIEMVAVGGAGGATVPETGDETICPTIVPYGLQVTTNWYMPGSPQAIADPEGSVLLLYSNSASRGEELGRQLERFEFQVRTNPSAGSPSPVNVYDVRLMVKVTYGALFSTVITNDLVRERDPEVQVNE